MIDRLIDDRVLDLCEVLWRFNSVRLPLEDPDAIIALGSNDLRVAELAAEIALRQPNALLICSGGVAHQDDLLRTNWLKSEGEMFACVARLRGVDNNRIIVEHESTNTSENLLLSRRALQSRGLAPRSILLIQKPFMSLRAILTARKQWNGPRFGVEHEGGQFRTYYDRVGSPELVDVIVGDTDRIIRYPAFGYFESVELPDVVRDSFSQLCRAGFTRHLII